MRTAGTGRRSLLADVVYMHACKHQDGSCPNYQPGAHGSVSLDSLEKPRKMMDCMLATEMSGVLTFLTISYMCSAC